MKQQFYDQNQKLSIQITTSLYTFSAMNLSPARSKPNLIQNKPKISFVYQNSSPISANKSSTPRLSNKQNRAQYIQSEISKSPIVHQYAPSQSQLNRNISSPNFNRNIPVFLKQKNANITPFEYQNRITGKPSSPVQNSSTFIPQKQNHIYIPHLQPNFTRSNVQLASVSKISQKSQEQSRASQTVKENVPEFCISEEKSVFHESQSSSFIYKNNESLLLEKCSNCGKKDAAYQAINTKNKLCTECGISEMIAGSELTQLKNKSSVNKKSQILSDDNSYTSQNESLISHNQRSGKSSHIVRQPSRQIETQQLLNQVSSEKKSLLLLYKSFQANQKSHISNFYKQKKYSLKQHYQRIKTAIKQSIQADIKQLDRLQQQQKVECQDQKKRMADDIQILQNIESDITKNYPMLIDKHEIDHEKYLQIINNHRLNSSRITNYCDQYQNQNQRRSFSMERMSENFEMSFINKNEEINLYDARTYRMYISKGLEKNRSEVLFSFENPKAM